MASPDPLFSVVVPTYGRPRYLRAAVGSVLAQTVDDLECIVVDDASPEPVHLPADPRVRVLHRSRNGGPAAARNTGVAEARGRFIAFLDDDDLFLSDRLALALEGLARAPVATCLFRAVHGPAHRAAGPRLEGWVHDRVLDDLTPPLGATAVRRDRALPLDEGLDNMEDLDWWLRITTVAPVATVPHVGLLFRHHSGPRHRTDTGHRLAASVAFVEREAAYLSRHRRAAAFRWKQVGLLALRSGDNGLARRAFLRAARLRPDPACAAHLVRSLRAAT